MDSLKPTIPLAELGSEHADVLAWIVANEGHNELATLLSNRLVQFKLLTAHQLAMVQRAITESAEEFQGPRIDDPDGLRAILCSFDMAMSSGVRHPTLRLAVFLFVYKQSEVTGQSSIHVLDTEHIGLDDAFLFLGKIRPCELITSRDCSVERRREIVQACSDPLNSAIEYGHRTGTCSACGKPLTDKKSIKQGIHISCANKWFNI